MKNREYIAGKLTPADWYIRSAELATNKDVDAWSKTFEEYFHERLRLRYLDPIKVLQSEGTYQGEGFTIVSIQCALIEFLAASREGLIYNRRPTTEFEYSRSGELFKKFLSQVDPFKTWFSEEIAHEFYVNVRCGLLHEASTKAGWKIWASGSAPINADNRTVFRNQLQEALLEYIDLYGKQLVEDKLLQAAFIRKFDSLAANAS